MKIAIIGSGISGLTAAYYLHAHHDITVYEANPYVGGHTNTLDVEFGGESHRIDTGFIVFNDWTYPNYIRILDELGVASKATCMSFSVRCDRTGLEYNGNNLNTLFSQRKNLCNFRFYRMLWDILRFNRCASSVLQDCSDQLTVERYCREERFSDQFVNQYLFPMGAAIWSCPPEKFAQFPIRFIVEFYRNHGLLNILHRPTWRVIANGSRTYVDALTSTFRERILLNCPVQSVSRGSDSVRVQSSKLGVQHFDHVVFACHSDQALAMLTDSSDLERKLLGAFPYESNTATLHTDESVLPHSRRAWAAWNYHICNDAVAKATVTYDMNILQGLQSKYTFCVTLNGEDRISPAKIIRSIKYHHPVYTTRRAEVQQRHHELIGVNRTSYCGAYWGNGFHEDGVNSAITVCERLKQLQPGEGVGGPSLACHA